MNILTLVGVAVHPHPRARVWWTAEECIGKLAGDEILSLNRAVTPRHIKPYRAER
jgi:hypothetical protein